MAQHSPDSERRWWGKPTRRRIGEGVIIILLATLILGVVHHFSTSPGGPGPSSTSSSGAAANSGGSSSPASATASPSLWFQGQITITNPGIQLDAKPPTSQTDCTLVDIAGYLHNCPQSNSMFAAWTGPSIPTRAQCLDWAKSNTATQLQLEPGMQLCVVTDMQRPAYVEIKSVSPDLSSATAQVIVWNI